MTKKGQTTPEQIKRTRLFVILFLFLYVALNAVLLYFHEPWRDEAQAWLLARDLSPWQLILRMSDEGHPALWHFILMPFAKLGFPFKTIEIVSLVVMSVTAYLMLAKAPFHPVFKVLLLFSPAFVYYYPAIARSYCLIALLLVLLAIVYPARNERPLRFGIVVALLIQTHVLMLGFAGLVGLFWLSEAVGGAVRTKTKIRWKGILAALLPPVLSVGAFAFQTMRVVNTNILRYKLLSDIGSVIREMISTVGDSYADGAGYGLAFW